MTETINPIAVLDNTKVFDSWREDARAGREKWEYRSWIITDQSEKDEAATHLAKRSPPESLGVIYLAGQHIIELYSPSSYFDCFILSSIFLKALLLACINYRV